MPRASSAQGKNELSSYRPARPQRGGQRLRMNYTVEDAIESDLRGTAVHTCTRRSGESRPRGCDLGLTARKRVTALACVGFENSDRKQ